jgi:hypothetical protein
MRSTPSRGARIIYIIDGLITLAGVGAAAALGIRYLIVVCVSLIPSLLAVAVRLTAPR